MSYVKRENVPILFSLGFAKLLILLNFFKSLLAGFAGPPYGGRDLARLQTGTRRCDLENDFEAVIYA